MFRLASEHARRAVEGTKKGGQGLAKVDQLASIGAAAELLVKATLAGIDVSLLAGNASTPTLLALIGSPLAHQGSKVITVGGAEGVRRLNECRPPGVPAIAQPQLVFEVRNDALHMGLAVEGSAIQAALTELVTLASSVFEIRRALQQDADWAEFWSPKHLTIVDALQQAGYSQLRRHLGGLLDEARKAYARLIAGLGPDERNRLIAELVTRAPEINEMERLQAHTCPACGNTLWVVYDLIRDIEIDDSDAPNSFGYVVKQSGSVSRASCPVCSLVLSQDDMVLTDIPFVIDLGQDEATADEIEGWQDAQHDEWASVGYEPDPTDDELDFE
ncbi:MULTISPECIES: hypothetical protein [Mycobacterium avium complex (MAC)]|uniref:Uncharacterized protein n=1 Tax=Mycobacterium indicus pranii (strain DSM 45239 / MTCC 9506) TaxID=1232724 RepID=J9W9G8_MYCIP|nr:MULTISPECIES: hypothetical protein [Mycobacterium avium complex (MAC)]AFS13640.1 Hypothetical protein MIP_02394 [Mycobacterium intracellulare subsp. intracellulare MTCC 9506]BCO51212.1 hypothetical protein MINTM003_16530 [Mycobacterium paraintracellulare]BCO88398.1 hypothetical protein MINTM015_16550 [Mycobacterium paraintracellulare]